jgi:hypothetical protein
MYPLSVISPAIAKAISHDGWSKADLQNYLFDKIRMPAGLIEKFARATDGVSTFSLQQLVAEGRLLPEYCESDDPQRLVRTLIKPEMIEIVIAGDPERNQSRGYAQNARRGAPMSKRVVLPERWQDLLNEARRERDRLMTS